MIERVRRPLVAATIAVLGAGVAVTALTAGAAPVPKASKCRLFPRDNHWNARIDALPVAAGSDATIATVGGDDGLHPDFGSGLYEGAPIGIPFDVVSKRTTRSRVGFEYADESDRVRYPIPAIEGGGDRHALLLDKDACKLYELYALRRDDAAWQAGSGAVWSLRSNRLRPRGHTSADAAGLPILPGLARYDEVRRGRIDHALRFTVSRTRNAFVYPARHQASSASDPRLPRMGERFRLKAGVDISDYPKQARVVLQALKTYGMIVADNGSDWYISGAPNAGWDNDQLARLRDIKGSDFEVVDTSSLPRPRGAGAGAAGAGP